MVKAKVTVLNQYGLHARAAVTIVNEASRYQADVYFVKGDDRINAKSILGVMVLEGVKGTELTVEAEGSDERDALTAMVALFHAKFHED